jgi:putative transposase
MMYTTNVIESINSQFKKISRPKAIFPTDKSLEKILYLVTQNISKKWTQKYDLGKKY